MSNEQRMLMMIVGINYKYNIRNPNAEPIAEGLQINYMQ